MVYLIEQDMMFETNTEQNAMRIPLARAAQLTGYHQDYLGQLCRMGKLQATKIGRNWFTTPEALNNLSSVTPPTLEEKIVDEIIQEKQEPEVVQTQYITSAPMIAENVVISEVQGMPIAIRTLPTATRHANNVQTIVTNVRIQNLQQEVSELRQLLFRLMEEVKSHTSILQTHETINRVQDSLKHSYVSNFDFNDPQAQRQFPRTVAAQQEPVPQPYIWMEPKRAHYHVLPWVAASLALVAISFIWVSVINKSFFGTAPPVATLYYQSEAVTPIEQQSEVAGATDESMVLLPQ